MMIRPATLDDCASVARVQVASYQTAYEPFFPPAYLEHFTLEEQTEDWRTLLERSPHTPLLVAVQDAEVVGYVLGKPQQDEVRDFDAEAVALHVLKAYQKRGIGTRLLAAMAFQLKQYGASSLVLWTIKENPVRAFYERLGGLIVGQKQYDVDNWTITEVAYGWQQIDDVIDRLEASLPKEHGNASNG